MRALALWMICCGACSLTRAQVEVARSEAISLNHGVVIAEAARHELGQTKSMQRIEGAPLELQDFSVSFLLEVENARSAEASHELLSIQANEPLSFAITRGKMLEVKMGDASWQADLGLGDAGRDAVAVTLSVKRDPRQAVAGLWVNGIEAASLVVKPGSLKLKADAAVLSGGGLKGTLSALQVHDRALTREEILALALPKREAPALQPFTDAIEIADDETLVVLGGSEAVALMEEGSLEALLLAKTPQKRLKMRSLAWETDTVWRQDRPLNFGSLTQQLRRAEATAVLLIFGRQECLERGASGVADFREALGAMVGLCLQQTPRVLMVLPPWFEKGDGARPDLTPRNRELASYHAAILAVAAQRGLPVAPAMSEAAAELRLTTDGLNLNDAGATIFARHISVRFKGRGVTPQPEDFEALREEVREKNQLWHEYWRPSNWAFLFGDRTGQPSSRDHLNPQVRWFPAELEKYKKLIETREQQIWRQAAELERRVP